MTHRHSMVYSWWRKGVCVCVGMEKSVLEREWERERKQACYLRTVVCTCACFVMAHYWLASSLDIIILSIKPLCSFLFSFEFFLWKLFVNEVSFCSNLDGQLYLLCVLFLFPLLPRRYWWLAFEACLGGSLLMKNVWGASLIGDLTLSSLSQLPTVILVPLRDAQDRSIDWSSTHTSHPLLPILV